MCPVTLGLTAATAASTAAVGTAAVGKAAIAGGSLFGGSFLGSASTALGLVGTAVQAIGSYQQASATQSALNAEAAARDRAAREAIEAGDEEERRHRTEAGYDLSLAEAAMAANGVRLATGSAHSVLTDYAEAVERDALIIDENSKRQARGHSEQAEIARTKSASTGSAGVISGVGSFLGQGASVADKWYRRSQAAA